MHHAEPEEAPQTSVTTGLDAYVKAVTMGIVVNRNQTNLGLSKYVNERLMKEDAEF